MEIKKYSEGDEQLILKLFESSFGQTMSLDYWKWRFLDNPVIDSSMIYLMWDEEVLVGHYAVSPNQLIVRGQEVLAALSMTTMTHPNYGGRGVFTRLAKELYEKEHENNNLQIVWGYPNNKSHRGFIKNLQWQNICVIPKFSIEVNNLGSIKTNGFIREIKKFLSNHALCHQELSKCYDVAPLKSESFLNWRYINNPVENYYCLEVGDTGAFIVVKLYDNVLTKTKEIDVVEWCVPKDLVKINEVLGHVVQLFGSEMVTRINMWLPLNDVQHTDFEKIGFVNTSPITYMGYVNLNSNHDFSCSHWYYQMGDSDVF